MQRSACNVSFAMGADFGGLQDRLGAMGAGLSASAAGAQVVAQGADDEQDQRLKAGPQKEGQQRRSHDQEANDFQ
jgi:hypothetical protein